MWPRRAFPALMWPGVFDRYPNLKLVFTEAGCGWILEALRLIEFKAANPIFKYFTADLKLTPREYFARNCFIGASNTRRRELISRYEIGVGNICWGNDFPHPEGSKDPIGLFEATMDGVSDTARDSFYEHNFVEMMGAGLG